MLSINTNLSSLIAQSSMKMSTNKLNEAIERMSTGYKINHVKDNAANYSISTNMTTKMNAYMVAEDNTAMGIDMVSTASDTLSQMQDHAERLRALATQARNGTYGAQSLNAIQEEANAITKEIERLYVSAEYNGIDLFAEPGSGCGQESKFVSNPTNYSGVDFATMKTIGDFVSGSSDVYKISSADDLAELASIVNADQDTSSATFVLTEDIDLTDWQNQHGDWISIGDSSQGFAGIFDGNGHVIKNLRQENLTVNDQRGVFGRFEGQFAIKNLGVEDAKVIGTNTSSAGIIASDIYGGTGEITNCYVTGSVFSDVNGSSGSLVGVVFGIVDFNDCISYADVKSNNIAGGLVGAVALSNDLGVTCNFNNCASYGTVSGDFAAGGLIGGMVSLDATPSLTGLNINNCKVSNSDLNPLGSGLLDLNTGNSVAGIDYSTILSGITEVEAQVYLTPISPMNLQVGINNNESSQIVLKTGFLLDFSTLKIGIESENMLTNIDKLVDILSAKQTELGSVQNRLESVLEEIGIQYDNLASSRSTIRDADMAELSSTYIQQQILQQAAATLMSTANQSPAIALQLI